MLDFRNLRLTTALAGLLGVTTAIAADGSAIEIARLTAADAAAGDQFGDLSIALDGDTVVVPSNRDDNENGNAAGAAYVFERNAGGPNSWGQVAKLIAADGGPNDRFGTVVAIDGDLVVASAVKDDSRRGSAYVFQRDPLASGAWVQVAKLVASDREAADEFGASVAISGERVVVGANFDDHAGGVQAGSIYVFERNEGGPDTWGQAAKIVAPDAATGDHFGEYVALLGDILVTTSHLDDDNGADSGSAYVFEHDAGTGTWNMKAKLLSSDGAAGDQLGESVEISDATLIVGNRRKVTAGTVAGAAYLFGRNAGGLGAWGEIAKLAPADASPGDEFGFTSAIDGDLAAVGARLHDGGGVDTGVVYLFGRNVGGPDAWGQVDRFAASDSGPGDHFGVTVAIDVDTVIVGANLDDDAGSDSGSAYVFSIDADGDSVPDGVDQCADSNLGEFLTIDGCETGVPNFIFENGCTLMDLTQECADGAQTHGDFVSCISHLANELKSSGLISGREKGAIQRCAARAAIP